MKLHYKGKYNLDPESLPRREHEPGAVMFKEAKDSKQLAWIANGIGIALIVIFCIPFFVRFGTDSTFGLYIGCLLSLVTMFPHEFLHAVCFKEDAYVYTNFKQGMLFVVGPERMSKARYIFMSLLPNIVFGFLPFTFGMIFGVDWLCGMGVFCIGMGAGDYYNVFNAATQMPKGARTYLHGFNSFWYMPQ
nr:DUF3267 domain-containing protein [Clostridia bacterium]